MSEENQKDKDPMLSDIKGCIVYACGLNPHGVARFESLNTVISRFKREDGLTSVQSLPSIHTKAVTDAGQEYAVDFPIFVIDIDNIDSLDKIKDLLKDRIDKAFEAYKERWVDLKIKREALKKTNDNIRKPQNKVSDLAKVDEK